MTYPPPRDYIKRQERLAVFQENLRKLQALTSNSTRLLGEEWQPARPVGGLRFWERLKGAWFVLIGKAQYIRWYR